MCVFFVPGDRLRRWIVGEALSSKDGRQEYPEIPWADIVAMRNRLIHVCFDADLDRVWDTVTDDLPPLISTLESILSQLD